MADVARIACPVYGFYGGNDARVNATIPQSAALMKHAGKTYEPETYDGAGHGFLRVGEAPDAIEANKTAREEAWKRLKELLKPIRYRSRSRWSWNRNGCRIPPNEWGDWARTTRDGI